MKAVHWEAAVIALLWLIGMANAIRVLFGGAA